MVLFFCTWHDSTFRTQHPWRSGAPSPGCTRQQYSPGGPTQQQLLCPPTAARQGTACQTCAHSHSLSSPRSPGGTGISPMQLHGEPRRIILFPSLERLLQLQPAQWFSSGHLPLLRNQQPRPLFSLSLVGINSQLSWSLIPLLPLSPPA